MTTIAMFVCRASFWLLFYIFVGYPLIMWLWGKL